MDDVEQQEQDALVFGLKGGESNAAKEADEMPWEPVPWTHEDEDKEQASAAEIVAKAMGVDPEHAQHAPEPKHSPAPKLPHQWPRTQKARGVKWLADNGIMGVQTGGGPIRPDRVSIHPGDGIHRGQCVSDEKLFARPCPFTPRHGFIESRPLRNFGDALDMMGQVLKADPYGEVIIMPLLSGAYSAVATNAGTVWGLNHDGATGEHETLMVPSPTVVADWNNVIIGPKNYAQITDCAYLELVENADEVVMVQVRSGPVQSANVGDFIPEDVVVTSCISPSDVKHDLGRWETLVKRSAKKKGVVILINSAPNRASHFAVHGIIAGLPIVFSIRPFWLSEHKGKTLTATEENESAIAPMIQSDYEELANEVMVRLNSGPKDTKDAKGTERDRHRVETSIGVCHAMGGWGPEKHLLALRAEGVVNCFLYTTYACLGELRHFYHHGPGRLAVSPEKPMLTDLTQFMSEQAASVVKACDGPRISRERVYKNSTGLAVADLIGLMKTARVDLAEPGWKKISALHNTANNGYGGVRWAESATLAWQLGRALVGFCKKPSAERWLKASMLYNRTINSCHNGGKVLTKWCGPGYFITGSSFPGFCLMNPVVAETVLGLSPEKMISRAQTLREFKRKTREVRI